MELETKNLILRAVGPEDVREVARMWDIDGGQIPEEDARQVIAQVEENHRKNRPGHIYHLCLAVTERIAPEVIAGWCGLDGTSGDKLHIFYSILPEHRGKGYATQAAKAVLKYAFTQAEVPFVNGGCFLENSASRRVMEKAGMSPAGTEENGDLLFFLDRDMYLKELTE